MTSSPPTPLFDASFLHQLEKLHLATRQIFTGHLAAKNRSQAKGSGMEFADVRDYAPGDDLRQVDWSLYGRIGKLFTRLYHVEQDQSVYLLFDASPSMAADPAKFATAQKIAAALAFIALANLDRVTFLPFGEEIGEVARDVRGKKQIMRIFEALSKPPLPGPSRFPKVVSQFLSRFQRPGVVLIISDFFDPEGLSALSSLALIPAARHEASLIRVFSPEEAEPKVRGHVTLQDAETGKIRKIHVTRKLAAEYKKAFAAYTEGIRQLASSRKLNYVETRSDLPFEEFVLKALRSARVLV